MSCHNGTVHIYFYYSASGYDSPLCCMTGLALCALKKARMWRFDIGSPPLVKGKKRHEKKEQTREYEKESMERWISPSTDIEFRERITYHIWSKFVITQVEWKVESSLKFLFRFMWQLLGFFLKENITQNNRYSLLYKPIISLSFFLSLSLSPSLSPFLFPLPPMFASLIASLQPEKIISSSFTSVKRYLCNKYHH